MTAPIRVLELLVSTELGGGPAHVSELVARLPRGEFELTIGAPGGGPYAGIFCDAGVSFVELACDRVRPAVLGQVGRLARELGIRIIHSHGKGAGLYGRLAARRAGIPALHTFHGIHFKGYPPGLRGAYLVLERWLARSTHTIVHVSESQAREARQLGLAPAGRSRVIVNGIDAGRVRSLARDRGLSRGALGLSAEGAVIGTVGRFDPVKALDVLLEAFARLAVRDRRAALLIVGDGPEGQRLHARARRLGVGGRVVFAGAVPDAARCLGVLDLYVSASRGEGLPLSLLEAMACGLPVVATRVAGHLDVVEDGVTGVLAPPDDREALALAMAGLLADDGVRRRMGDQGRARVEARFSADRMAAEVAALYREAARPF